MPRQTTPVTTRASLSLTIMDIAGRNARASLTALTASPSTPQITAFKNAVGDMTNGAVTTVSGTAQDYDNGATRVVFDEAHAGAPDKAVFIFQNDARQTRRLEIPAPDASIFGTDGQTVDAANPLVVALNDATLAILGGSFRMTRGFLSTKTRKSAGTRVAPIALEPGAGDNPPALPAEVPEP